MRSVAVVVYLIGCLLGSWQRGVRASRGEGHGVGAALLILGGAALVTLIGFLRAGSLTGRGGNPVTPGTAAFLGFLFMLVGAGVALYAIWKYTPADGSAEFPESLGLTLAGTSGLLVLLAWFDA